MIANGPSFNFKIHYNIKMRFLQKKIYTKKYSLLAEKQTFRGAIQKKQYI